MRGLVTAEELGPAKGIFQGGSPPPNTVADARNIDTSEGTWKLRPGLQDILSAIITSSWQQTIMLAEYVPDLRYSTSHQSVILAGDASNNPTFGFRAKEIVNTQLTNGLASPVGSEVGGESRRYSSAMHLWKYTVSDDITDYTPALVLSDGISQPMIYHQKAESGSAVGTLEMLDAIDGGYSDISCLGTPPRGKYCAVFKERLFMANTPAASNRVWHTTPTSGGVHVCNVWPASYNFDVQYGETITGLMPFRDVLAIFTKENLYALTGDGVGGLWSLDLVDGSHGAINGQCIVDISDSLVFLANDGVYRWAGQGAAKRVSHPHLEKTWEALTTAESASKVQYAVHDLDNERVIFVTGTGTTSLDLALVYYYKDGHWDVWGAWPEAAGSILHDAFPDMGILTKEWAFTRPTMIGVYSGYMCKLGGESDLFGSTTYPIHWYIQTQRHFLDDPEIKTLRHVMVMPKLSGDWDLVVLPLVDDEGMVEAHYRDADTNRNLIVDSGNTQIHAVGGKAQFQAVADGPVDVYYVPVNYKLGDSLILLKHTTVGEIKFAVAFDSTGKAGELLVMAEDMNPAILLPMDQAPHFDATLSTWDDAVFTDPDFVRIITGYNATGRSFALWISNVGSYNSGTDWAKPGMPMEIKGWGLWHMPRGTLRV